MNVKIVSENMDFSLPEYATEGSAGMDLKANEVVSIPAGGRRVVKTGIYIQLPDGYEAQIRPRSGMAAKRGITVLNAPGTIDSDYVGEIGVILHNASNKPETIFMGDKIAQMVVAKYEKVKWEQLSRHSELEETERGSGGFGSTGQ